MEAAAERKLVSLNTIQVGEWQNLLSEIDSISMMWQRSYESPAEAYMLVFNPYTTVYQKGTEYYESKKFLDSVEKYLKSLKPVYYFITREVLGVKLIHINAYILCEKPIKLQDHGAKNHYYGMWSKKLDTYHMTRFDVLTYMFKENNYRCFEQYLDYTQSLIKQSDIDLRNADPDFIDII